MFTLNIKDSSHLSENEKILLANAKCGELVIDHVKSCRTLKLKKIPIQKTIMSLKDKGFITCKETRYDFKNTKISTGLFGINRIFLPSSIVFPTLVASDTNDYVALNDIGPVDLRDYKDCFINEIYKPKKFRKITKKEACTIQGFPSNFTLPESRPRWMKLIGNSVSPLVIDMLCKAIIETNIFRDGNNEDRHSSSITCDLNLMRTSSQGL